MIIAFPSDYLESYCIMKKGLRLFDSLRKDKGLKEMKEKIDISFQKILNKDESFVSEEDIQYVENLFQRMQLQMVNYPTVARKLSQMSLEVCNVVQLTMKIQNKPSQSSGGLQLLFHDFYKLLKEYLQPSFYLNLMNTSKACFAELKKLTVNYSLNSELTEEFFKNIEFRNRVLQRVSRLDCQVRFTTDSNFSHNASNGFRIKSSDCSLISFDHLPKIEDYFSLYSIDYLWSHGSLPKGVSSFIGVLEISLMRVDTPIDCVPMKHCKSLMFSFCEGLTDVSALHSVYDLRIAGCPRVEDISALVDNNVLMIGGCTGIKKYSTFRNVKNLCLSTPNIPSLHDLELIPCPSVNLGSYEYQTGWKIPNPKRKIIKFRTCHTFTTSSTINFLSSVYSVSFFCCNGLADISCLNRVPYILLYSCPALTSLEGLGPEFNRRIIVQDCHNIISFLPLDGCEEVEISNCLIRDISELSHVKSLTISYCKIPFEVPFLGKVSSLSLVGSDSLTNVNGLENVPILKIKNCPNVTNFDLLQNNNRITLDSSLLKVTDFSFFSERYLREVGKTSITFLRTLM